MEGGARPSWDKVGTQGYYLVCIRLLINIRSENINFNCATYNNVLKGFSCKRF